LSLTIALDAMGGDYGPVVVIPAAVAALRETPSLRLVLVGDSPAIERALSATPDQGRFRSQLTIHHTTQEVSMDELPSSALRTKKDSSMRVAIDLVKRGDAHACVSSGNTGALMATARFVLKTLPGVDRPAIISALPSADGQTHVLDLGANIDATAEQLFQFAVIGSVLVSEVHAISHPRVGLLNIGAEEIKGNESIKAAARLLQQSELNYIGFVEGDDIYKGGVDVVACDGFIGNVALKSSEGVARMIGQMIEQEFRRTWWTKAAGAIAMPVLRAVRGRIDPRSYNGASFVGLRGIVIKSHGSADAFSFANAIREAVAEVEKNVPERISEHLGAMLSQREAV
jgi:glycerol-3-phosphate acyltransferase PlsX